MATATASKTKLKIFPLADRVVIRPLEETETMKGGLYIPDTAKEKPIQGEIVAVGPGRREKHELVPMELEDEVENMGAQMVKEVATKTSDLAGDGTTTATVLAQAIFREGLKSVTAGSNPMALKRGIDKAVETVVEELKKISVPTAGRKEIAQVGTISANNDHEIGKLIAEAMEKVGKDGVITVDRKST